MAKLLTTSTNPGVAAWLDAELVTNGGFYEAPLTAYVGPGHPRAVDDSDLATPFVTIQAALDAIGTPINADDQKQRFTIVIEPGEYDEDLATPAGRRLVLIPLGPVTLGDGAGVDYASTTPRDIDVDCTPAFGGRVSFVLGSLTNITTSNFRGANAAGFRISGDLLLTGAPTTSLASAIRLASVFVDGNFDATGLAALGVDVQLHSVRVQGTSGGVNAALFKSRDSDLRGLATFLFVGSAQGCNFNGLTVALPPNAQGLSGQPAGMYNTYFAGTFTGPAGSCWMDGATNYWFKANGAVLAGGATKTILDDTVP